MGVGVGMASPSEREEAVLSVESSGQKHGIFENLKCIFMGARVAFG